MPAASALWCAVLPENGAGFAVTQFQASTSVTGVAPAGSASSTQTVSGVGTAAKSWPDWSPATAVYVRDAGVKSYPDETGVTVPDHPAGTMQVNWPVASVGAQLPPFVAVSVAPATGEAP